MSPAHGPKGNPHNIKKSPKKRTATPYKKNRVTNKKK